MISFQPTVDLASSAEITFENMRSYYEHYSVEWELSKIQEQIAGLENWDVLYNGILVGAIRLAYDHDGGYLRDLQVSDLYRNQGIGAIALGEAESLVKRAGMEQLRLRVFKISPAYHLYKRMGFVEYSQEERFYYMSKKIS